MKKQEIKVKVNNQDSSFSISGQTINVVASFSKPSEIKVKGHLK